MELWEPAQELRRDHAEQRPARSQMGISAHTKKTPAGSRDCIVTNLSCCQGKIQLSASQHGVPDCRGAPLALRSGWVRGERAAAKERRTPPECLSHPTAHHHHPRPPHQPPSPDRNQQTRCPMAVHREPGVEVPRKSQQCARHLPCVERESYTRSTSCEMKIQPNANWGLCNTACDDPAPSPHRAPGCCDAKGSQVVRIKKYFHGT